MKNSIKTILRRLNLLNIKEYPYLNFATSNEKFFQAINYTLKDFEDEEDYGVPLAWHSKFIINNINYLKNDYEKLYEEIFNEENNYLNQLKILSPKINIREEMNLNCAENNIENMKYYTKNLEKAKKMVKVKNFIVKDKTEICLSLKENKEKKKNKENKHNKEKDEIKFSKTFNAKNYKNFEFNKNFSLQANPINKCIHLSEKFLLGTLGQKDKIIESHVKSVQDFIYKLTKPKGIIFKIIEYIKEEIRSGNTTNEVYNFFSQYKQILKNSLLTNFKDLIENKNEPDEIIEKLEDYILRKIYKYVFPSSPLPEDISFHETTKSYDWLKAEDFALEEDIPLEAIQDSISYLKQMEERANSVSEKLKCLQMVYKNINQITEFYFDQLDKSAEAQTPIFNYIIVKAHPKRFISNINYLNCFAKDHIFVRNCLASRDFVWGLSLFDFDISAEEFNKRCIESSKKFAQEKNISQ